MTVKPQRFLVGPEMTPGVSGTLRMVADLVELVPQLLEAFTVMLPLLKPLPNETVMALVPAPAVMLAPDGTVQIYEVAPDTGLTA